MSVPSDIRKAWSDQIWINGKVTNITQQIFDFDVTNDSQFEISKFYPDGSDEVNFFTYLVLRAPEPGSDSIGVDKRKYLHRVDVNYYLEADTRGLNFNKVIDRLITIESLVDSELGTRWDNTVDFFNLETVNPPTEVIIENKAVWRGQNIYLAEDCSLIT